MIALNIHNRKKWLIKHNKNIDSNLMLEYRLICCHHNLATGNTTLFTLCIPIKAGSLRLQFY